LIYRGSWKKIVKMASNRPIKRFFGPSGFFFFKGMAQNCWRTS
jgi:hypothetical protein